MLAHLSHLHAVWLFQRPLLGWDLGQSQLGVLARFGGVWRIALEGPVFPPAHTAPRSPCLVAQLQHHLVQVG